MAGDDASRDQRFADIRAAVAAELRAARIRLGIESKELAERAGMHPVEVSRFLSGSRRISIDQLFEIAPALNTTPGEILDAAEARYLKEVARRNADREGVVDEGLDAAR
jgi:transcriptional regulator with XRE-family HTH domain